MLQWTNVYFCFSLLLPCEASQDFVRLGKLPYPRPCFMRRSAVGRCSVWDASQYGRSLPIINIEETADMTTWGSVSLTLHSFCDYLYIFLCHILYFLCTNSSTQCMSNAAVNLCFLVLCHVKADLVLLSTLKTLPIWQHEDQFLLIFIVLYLCVYIFCHLLYFLFTSSCVQGISTVCCSKLILITFLLFWFSCHVMQVGFFVRLGKLPYPRPCFMRSSAVGRCSVWNASQYGRSVSIINVEETANMATWGSVSTLHSFVIMCIYSCVIYCISCPPIHVCTVYQLYAASNLYL